jgi:hypothetical protein
MNALKRTTRTLICSAGLIAAALLSACGGGDQGRGEILGLPEAQLTTVVVTPATASIVAGTNQQFTATANYADGTSRNVTTASAWVSATPAAATIGAASGLATGVAGGSSAISASYNGKTGAATLTVTPPPVLVSVTVTPANSTIAIGATRQFVATANYSNGTSAVVVPVWTSAAAGTSTIAASGIATGVASGTVLITATYNTIPGTALLNVTADGVPPVLPPAFPVNASVNMNSAASFAVLAGTSITNNAGGTTLVTGDVGSPSQTTDPVLAAGFTNYKSGAVLTAALADLQIAITDTNSRVCDQTSAAGIDLGGLTLPPGVYCFAGPISITGTFTMFGPGVYIFRTASTLNTAANSIVAVQAGANFSQVSWVPVGATTLGANSKFLGTVMAKSAAITMGANATLLNGRVLSGSAVTLNNNQITK